MMRELKFRAWDKMNKRMLAPAMPTLGGGITWGDGSYDSSFSQYVIMQFTGLKDMNGKDIYEGDIVRAKFPKNSRTIIFDVCSDPKNYEIVFVSGAFETSSVRVKQDKFSSLTDRLHPIWWDKYCEVIGNIYENPELLKEPAHG